MEKFKSMVVAILSFILTLIGFMFIFYYLQNEISVISFLIGLLGFMSVFLPAYEKWKEFFKDIIK